MKFTATLALLALSLAACSDEQPDFSNLSHRMLKSELLSDYGEPVDIQYLIDTGEEENLLLDQIPSEIDPSLVFELWTYEGMRTYQITHSRKYVERGEITVIFGGQDFDPEMVRGYWWTDEEQLAAEASASDT